MNLAPNVRWRTSKRGLVIAAPDGETFLLEHPRATALPELVTRATDFATLGELLGEPNGARLATDLADVGILIDADLPAQHESPSATRTALTRSGLEIDGIASIAHRFDVSWTPAMQRWPARLAILAVVAGGVVALSHGRPDLPPVSSQPAAEAVLGLVIGVALGFAHEFAHAVALAHYDRRAARAGFGFYWGGISFYVDSTDALTLDRRQRVVQALAGLGVDVVAAAALAIIAHLTPATLLAIVAWRLAVLGVLDIVVNLAPILEVDGHVALSDALDEPDLAPRSRRALGDTLRRRSSPDTPRWMPVYGAFSLACGVGLVIGSALVFWYATGDLIRALFAGNAGDIAIGVVILGPLVTSLLLSTIGLVLETVVDQEP